MGAALTRTPAAGRPRPRPQHSLSGRNFLLCLHGDPDPLRGIHPHPLTTAPGRGPPLTAEFRNMCGRGVVKRHHGEVHAEPRVCSHPGILFLCHVAHPWLSPDPCTAAFGTTTPLPSETTGSNRATAALVGTLDSLICLRFCTVVGRLPLLPARPLLVQGRGRLHRRA